jgi:hypothetical protein
LTSGKYKVMRILVHREAWPQLAGARNKRAGYRPPLFRLRIGLLDRSYDEGTNGDAGGLSAHFQPLVQRFRELDGGSGWHDNIMPQIAI